MHPLRKVDTLCPITNSLSNSLSSSTHVLTPFDFWLLNDVLPEETIEAIVSLPFETPSNNCFDGRRESNNSTRIYFTPENQLRFRVCRQVAEAFTDPQLIDKIETMTGSQIAAGHLRIEYCQDLDGFWLEPHTDISVKLFTMLVYLSEDPNLYNAGTDIYDATPEHNLVLSAPYERNRGLIFIPGENTWHGFQKRPIKGIRQSIIINYVSDEWRATEELS